MNTRGRSLGRVWLSLVLLSAVLAAIGWGMAASASSDPGAPANMAKSGAREAGVSGEAPIGAVVPTLPGGRVRTYYIAADPVAWDYAPRHRNMITGQALRCGREHVRQT